MIRRKKGGMKGVRRLKEEGSMESGRREEKEIKRLKCEKKEGKGLERRRMSRNVGGKERVRK